MSWDPQKNIALFEPGCIVCGSCGSKPDDPWDPAPEEFDYYSDLEQWECKDCVENKLVSDFYE